MTVNSKHTLGYCPLCECERVLCATCGNNCCNGTYGGIPEGKAACSDCPEAYEHQDLFWKGGSSAVKFAKDTRGDDRKYKVKQRVLNGRLVKDFT